MIKESKYLPEGYLIGTYQNEIYLSSPKMLERAMKEQIILESVVLSCAKDDLTLKVDLGGVMYGYIPKEEACIENENGEAAKDIAVITRVGRPVCFVIKSIKEENGVKHAVLSRKEAQKMCRREFTSLLRPGDIVPAAVTHIDPFGAFVDIGCGIVSLLNIDCISVSRISHPKDRLKKGDKIFTVVKSRTEDGRIYMTLRELLGTWDENVASFETGSTVNGIVRSIEGYGIFVELAPNLAGLAERCDDVNVGDSCAVYIKNIIRERMKVKLSVIDSYIGCCEIKPLKYYVDCENTAHLSSWLYSPAVSQKKIETVFD